MVQAVNGAGLTTLATNLGGYYTVNTSTAVPTPTATVFVTNPGTGSFQHPMALTARVTPAVAGRVVVFDLAGQQVSAVTGANGEATASITPVVPPGSYNVVATFRSDSSNATSSESIPITVARDTTSLTVVPAVSAVQTGQVNAITAKLRDSTNRPLGGKAVAFVVSGNGQQMVRPVIADHWGDAALGPVSLPAGAYTVTAFFGGGQTVLAADENYAPSQSTPVTLTINSGVPPTINASATNADAMPYVAGTWTKQDVIVHFTCTDAVAVASCTPDQTITAEGTTPAVIGSATNSQGQITPTSFGPVKIDRTGPTANVTMPAAGATYVSGTTTLAAYSCSDAGSGLSTCAGPVGSGAAFDTSGSGPKSFVVNTTDAVGNSSVLTVPYNVSLVATMVPVVKADMGVPGLEEIGFPTNIVGVYGTFTDPEGAKPYTAAVRWKTGDPFSPFVLSSTSAFLAPNVLPTGTSTVTIRICNKLGHCGTDDVTIRIKAAVQVTPVRECVIDLGASASPRYRARFGYDNTSSYPIVLLTFPLPPENIFTTAPYRRNQPQVFLPGSPRNVFTETFPAGSSVTWPNRRYR